MPNVLVEEASLAAIAQAIREKSKLEDTFKPGEMAQAILDMPGEILPSAEEVEF